MKQFNILIAGCGDVGSALGLRLLENHHKVTGLRRNISQLPPAIQGIAVDLTQIHHVKQNLAGQSFDILIYAAAASEHSEAGYQAAYVDGFSNVLNALATPPEHIFFTSSSGVYHQNDSDWVDETSPCQPQRFSGQIMLQAEQNVLNSPSPATVVRFSGIYGPGRNHLLKRVQSGDGAPATPTQFSNRIHRDDCAGVLHHLITQLANNQAIEDCYLATDNCPVSMHEVTHWLAGELGVEIKTETLSRRAGSKRCSNQRLKASGYEFLYPSFKEGYKALIAAQAD